MLLNKKVGLVLLAATLVGCNQRYTYSYLIDHPLVLKQQIEKCQSIEEPSNADSPQCKDVFAAAVLLSPIIREQQADPEKFGEEVMLAQAALVKTHEALVSAQQEVDALRAKNVSGRPLENVLNKLNITQQAYQKQNEDLKVRLAVLGMASPE